MGSTTNDGQFKARVMFVLPSLKRAGAETQTVDLVNGLCETNFEKHLFTFEAQQDQLDRVNRQNVIVHHRPRTSRTDLEPSRALARLLDSHHIEVVHCSLQIALFVGWAAIALSDVKPRLVVALHTTVNRGWREELFDRLIYQWMMRSCDLVICVCKAQKSFWDDKYPFLKSSTVVVYNGVDPSVFQPDSTGDRRRATRISLGIPEDATVACCIAAFRPEKGHLVLLEAFAAVLREDASSYLLLAGDGPLRTASERWASELGIASNIRFLGAVRDVKPVLSASDIAVISSTTVETFSIAMLEALAMEVPMVSTDVGGAREAILDGVTGQLVSPGDSVALGRAMIRMMTEGVLRRQMGRRGRRLVSEQFTRDRMVRDTAALLTEAAAKGRRGKGL